MKWHALEMEFIIYLKLEESTWWGQIRKVDQKINSSRNKLEMKFIIFKNSQAWFSAKKKSYR